MDFTTIAMIALLVVAFYFLILRPQKKRQQAQQKTMNELLPGTRVLLGSGVFGTLTWVGEKQARMETAPGVELTVLKQAIARVVSEGDEYSEPDEVDEDDELEDDELAQAGVLDPVDERDDRVVEPLTEPVVGDVRPVRDGVDEPVHPEVDGEPGSSKSNAARTD